MIFRSKQNMLVVLLDTQVSAMIVQNATLIKVLLKLNIQVRIQLQQASQVLNLYSVKLVMRFTHL